MRIIISNSSPVPIYEPIKKAYDELEKEGYIVVVHGKGAYVASKNKPLVEENAKKEIENHITKALTIAKNYNISKEEIIDLINILEER